VSISGFSSSRIGFGHPEIRLRAPLPLIVWILFCVVCNFAGWVLSLLHQLNAAGYTVVFVVAIGAGFACGERAWRARGGLELSRLRRRFRRPFPLAFLGLALLAIGRRGGCMRRIIMTRWRIVRRGCSTGWPKDGGIGFIRISND